MKSKLLLLHGALGSKKQFELTKEFLEKYFEVYDLDFEGHGGFISEKEFSIRLFTENVVEFLRIHSIEQTDIFGYSMGGYVALHTALKHPEKVRRIITLGTKFNWDLASAEKEIRMLNPNKIAEKVPRFADKLRKEHQPQDWKEIVNKTARMMGRLAEGEKLTEEDFKQINHKVTIGIGSLDQMVSLEESERTAQMLPNGRLRSLPDFEHPLEKIDPFELASYIKQSI